MPGYILKIVIEHTHPPVWRRIVVPDRITFGDLHQIIQTAFQWQDCHLHEFRIPADRICIDQNGGRNGCHYCESETLIDPFVRSYGWIRYIYDPEADRRHKIIVEKTDPQYSGRCPRLLKAKGAPMAEESGERLAQKGTQTAFDQNQAEAQLAAMEIPANENLEEPVLLKESMQMFKSMMEQLMKASRGAANWKLLEKPQRLPSRMDKKIDELQTFCEQHAGAAWKLAPAVHTQEELLQALGEQEVWDYGKYLRIPGLARTSKKAQVAAISREFRQHPEYLLYVFDPEMFRKILRWMKLPEGTVSKELEDGYLLSKILNAGLGDFFVENGTGCFAFASDARALTERLDAGTRKRVYRSLEQFDTRLGNLVMIYGVIEVESLYAMYRDVYGDPIEKEDFLRFAYWHARCNDFVDTFYSLDGTAYVAAKDVDIETVMKKTEEYAKDIPYAAYSKETLEYLGNDVANRSHWSDILFSTLHYQLGLGVQEAQDLLMEIIVDIFNGAAIRQLTMRIEKQTNQKWTLELSAKLWGILTGLMLELELPMLKGRTREQYAEEQNVSPWILGMTEPADCDMSANGTRMYEFPAQMQEWMYQATAFGDRDAFDALLAEKQKNAVCSEEFLYLLADAAIVYGFQPHVEPLLRELKQSSPGGRKLARELEKHWEERNDVMDDEELSAQTLTGWPADVPAWDWDDWDRPKAPQPFVRQMPKVGRNDPCPCGSGKKYKKCCGASGG